jgi:hypothetical protein
MEPFIEWQDYEHNYVEHGKDWFWILGIVTISSSILSFYFGNVLFGIFILLAGVTLGLLAFRKPRVVDIKITNRSIIVGEMQYPYDNFFSFWIESDHMHGPRILLHPRNPALPLTAIMIGEGVDLDHLADVLNDYMDEVPMKESAIHKLFDYLGF